MNDQNNPSHDSAVEEQLDELFDKGTTAGEIFAEALRLNASPATLSRAARLTFDVDDSGQVSLPYVKVMMNHGWALARVREFLETLCFQGSDDEGYYPRRGVIHDEDAWQVFETAEQLVKFYQRVAVKEPDGVLRPEFVRRLRAYLTKLRPGQTRQNQQDELLLLQLAVREIRRIDSSEQLELALSAARTFSLKDKARIANAMNPTGWNLVFQGWVLAQGGDPDRDLCWVSYEAHHWLKQYPDHGVLIYRWLLEGVRRYSGDNWRFVNTCWLRWLAGTADWQFLRVIQTPQGHLQVELPGPGPKIVLRHNGSEELAEGDEVLVSRWQLKSLTPKHLPGTKLYELPLHPARPATAEMLVTRRAFYVGDRQRRR